MTALLVVAVLLLVASPTMAQQGSGGFQFEQSAHRLEIIPMYGYAWTLSKSATYNSYGGDFDLKSSGFWGVALDINAKPGVQARLLYRRQDTQLMWKQANLEQEVGDMAVEYWHVGAVGGMTKGNVMPFTSFTLGGTRFAYDGGDDWKFSILLSLGAKVYLNERIGLMVAGQMPFTFTDAFVGIGTGGFSFGGTGIFQFDVVGGLIITL
jgi:hypothetical protein